MQTRPTAEDLKVIYDLLIADKQALTKRLIAVQDTDANQAKVELKAKIELIKSQLAEIEEALAMFNTK